MEELSGYNFGVQLRFFFLKRTFIYVFENMLLDGTDY